jgi:hypothetical protein
MKYNRWRIGVHLGGRENPRIKNHKVKNIWKGIVFIYIWGSLTMSIIYYGERTICAHLVRKIKLPKTRVVNNTNDNFLALHSMHN